MPSVPLLCLPASPEFILSEAKDPSKEAKSKGQDGDFFRRGKSREVESISPPHLVLEFVNLSSADGRISCVGEVFYAYASAFFFVVF